jgi:hypothetical protein
VVNGIPVSSINQTLLELAWLIRVDLPVERAVETRSASHGYRRTKDRSAGSSRCTAAGA